MAASLSTLPTTARPRAMFFVVGAPRCGTTAISKALRDHPGICFAEPKEPHYFSRLPPGWTGRRLGVDYFPLFFHHWRDPEAMLGEGSPSYLYADEAIEAIERELPGARYIVMVRNPMQMLPSYHQRLVYLLDESEADLAKAWRLQAPRAEGRLMPRRCRSPHLLRYREICNVADHIDRLTAKVGHERVKLVLFDDFQHSAIEVYREVIAFLGLPDDGRTMLKKRNSTRVPKSVLLHMLLMQPRSEIARLGLNRMRKAVRGIPFVLPLLGAIRRRSYTVAPTPVVPPELWDECADAFRDNVARLSVLFGRDLSFWLQRPQTRPTVSDSPPAMPVPT